jgi:hypothetical protein
VEWLKPLCRLMNLLGVELACFAGLDDLNGVFEGRGPVESAAERLPSKSSCGGVLAAFSGVNVVDELLSLLGGGGGDAAQGDPVRAPVVELPVNEAVVLGASYQDFCRRIVILWRKTSLEVVPISSIHPASWGTIATTRRSLVGGPQSDALVVGGGGRSSGRSSRDVDGGLVEGWNNLSSKTPRTELLCGTPTWQSRQLPYHCRGARRLAPTRESSR